MAESKSILNNSDDIFIEALKSIRQEHSQLSPQRPPVSILTPNFAPIPSIPIPQCHSKTTFGNIILPIVFFIILCSPVIVGYIFQLGIEIGHYVLSIYAFFTIAHFFIQCISATINRYQICRLPFVSAKGRNIGLLVVGYRENPEYWKQCLDSIKGQSVKTNIVAVIDGDKLEDEYMASEFIQIIPNATLLKPGFILSDIELKQQSRIGQSFRMQANSNICVLQPHKGKREAMYTGLMMLLDCEAIVVTDSDSQLDRNAVAELFSTLESDQQVGAVTGNVQIFNDDTVLSFLSSVRYWFSFNLERAADSFAKSVMCVSGPLGIYRVNVLKPILHEWRTQRFLGGECTYGDDRHLTNLVLNQGYRVLYSHLAKCMTETPTNWIRWLSQQTRWTKSFYREILFYRPQHFEIRNVWIYSSMIYNAVFPITNIYGIISVLYLPSSFYFKTSYYLVIWLYTIIIISIFKALFGMIVERKWRLILAPVYSFLYIILLLPIKLTSILFIRDMSWLTSPRLNPHNRPRVETLIPIIIWNLALLSGIVYTIVLATRQIK